MGFHEGWINGELGEGDSFAKDGGNPIGRIRRFGLDHLIRNVPQ